MGNWEKEYQEKLIKKETPAEKRFEKFLIQNSIEYEKQKKLIGYFGKIYFVDFFIPSRCLIVEIDGGYHNSEEQTKKDTIRTTDLTLNTGYRLIRLTNNETLLKNNELIDLVNERFGGTFIQKLTYEELLAKVEKLEQKVKHYEKTNKELEKRIKKQNDITKVTLKNINKKGNSKKELWKILLENNLVELKLNDVIVNKSKIKKLFKV